MFYRTPFQRRRLKHSYRNHFSRRALWLLVIVVALAFIIDSIIRPTILSASAAKVKLAVSAALNQAIETALLDEDISYKNFIAITYDSNNEVSSMSADYKNITKIQTTVTDQIVSYFTNTKQIKISIPLGTLLGNAFLAGMGPNINIQVLPVGSVKAMTKSDLTSAGINQTHHKITLTVTMDVVSIIPGYTSQLTVENDYPLAETVIVGNVPDSFAQILGQQDATIPYIMNELDESK